MFGLIFAIIIYMIDRLNPFVKMDDYYTVVESEGENLGQDPIREDSDTYKYDFKDYNSERTSYTAFYFILSPPNFDSQNK